MASGSGRPRRYDRGPEVRSRCASRGSGRVGTSDFAPAPLWHRGVLVGGGARLRVDHGQSRTPLEVAHECRPEFRIVRHSKLIRRFKQDGDAPAPLLLGEMTIQMLAKHAWMAAVLF